MPIVNRIDMLSTGIRSEVGVKIYGADLTVLDGLDAPCGRDPAAGARRRRTSTRSR